MALRMGKKNARLCGSGILKSMLLTFDFFGLVHRFDDQE